MRLLVPAVLCLMLPLFAACDTTHAHVPTVDRASAMTLVRADLVELAKAPSDTRWRRTYRHFDQHLESHLDARSRLTLELEFGALRRDIEASPENLDAIATRCSKIAAELQPQD